MVLEKVKYIVGIGILFFSCSNNDLPPCEQNPLKGPCDAAIPKYYFDKDEQQCKEFLWGGCDGRVPFDTLEECQECQ